jgi:SAM-dependent methyltransferase
MNEAEFDKFADEYRNIHLANIKNSGEDPEFFAEYKIIDIAKLTSKFGTSESLNILDYGCGIGNSIPFFKKHIKNCQLTAADISKKSLEIAESRFPRQAEFTALTGINLPFEENKFDIIFSACVFHHIPHDEHYSILKELRRTLKHNGILVIFEHNPYNPLTVKAVNTCPLDKNAVLVKPRLLTSTLKNVGLQNTTITYRIFFPGQLRVFRRLEPLLKWLPLGAQYYVTAHKLDRSN